MVATRGLSVSAKTSLRVLASPARAGKKGSARLQKPVVRKPAPRKVATQASRRTSGGRATGGAFITPPGHSPVSPSQRSASLLSRLGTRVAGIIKSANPTPRDVAQDRLRAVLTADRRGAVCESGNGIVTDEPGAAQ